MGGTRRHRFQPEMEDQWPYLPNQLAAIGALRDAAPPI